MYLKFPKAKMRTSSFSNDRELNFKDLGDDQGGVVGLSIQNVGTSDLLMDDQSQQIISPGESFTTPLQLIVTNEQFNLKFIKDVGEVNKAVIRYYILDQSCI